MISQIKMGLNKEIILKKAMEMADERGIASVTIKALATELGVKSPSLYKHVENLEELMKELMRRGWEELSEEALKAAVGVAKEDAVRGIFYACRRYAKSHPGVFDAMQWYNMYYSEQDMAATEKIVSVLFQVLDGYDLVEEKKVHIVRIFRSFLQGYLSIENHDGFGNPISVDQTFDFALEIILNGILQLKGGTNGEGVLEKY